MEIKSLKWPPKNACDSFHRVGLFHQSIRGGTSVSKLTLSRECHKPLKRDFPAALTQPPCPHTVLQVFYGNLAVGLFLPVTGHAVQPRATQWGNQVAREASDSNSFFCRDCFWEGLNSVSSVSPAGACCILGLQYESFWVQRCEHFAYRKPTKCDYWLKRVEEGWRGRPSPETCRYNHPCIGSLFKLPISVCLSNSDNTFGSFWYVASI